MIIDLVKEYDKVGNVTYHIKVDNQFVPGTVRLDLTSALEMYETVKVQYTLAREEVLVREEI
jgi:hypothetical protein